MHPPQAERKIILSRDHVFENQFPQVEKLGVGKHCGNSITLILLVPPVPPVTNYFEADVFIKIIVKGTTKSYIAHYSCMVIVLFNRLYVGLHFLRFLLET